MKMVRPKKKTLEEIYGSKLIVNNQKSQVQAVNGKNREREQVKIEHKCDKTGLIITMSNPAGPNDKKAGIPIAGNVTYRVTPTNNLNKPNNINTNTYRLNVNQNNKITNNTLNNAIKHKIPAPNTSRLNNHVNPKSIYVNNNTTKDNKAKKYTDPDLEVFNLESLKRCKPKAKTCRQEKRKIHVEKTFQYIPIESVNEDMPQEPPVVIQKQQNFKNRLFHSNSSGIQEPSNVRSSSSPTFIAPPKSLENLEVDKETAEFVGYIQSAVEMGVQKAMNASLQDSYNLIASKIENFTYEVKKLQLLLRKVQEDLSGKIVHYGEDTARHFRYLCMKSEYDKLFYQHNLTVAMGNVQPAPSGIFDQTFPSTARVPSCTPTTNMPQPPAAEPPTNPASANEPNSSRGNLPQTSSELYQSASSVSPLKTSPVPVAMECQPPVPDELLGEKEAVLNRIEDFCKRLKDQDNKLELCMKPPTGTLYNSDEIIIINREVNEDDESYMSSEAFTPTSTGNMAKYENQAMMAAKSVGYLAGGGGDAN